MKKLFVSLLLVFLLLNYAQASDLRTGGLYGISPTPNTLTKFINSYSVGNSTITDDGVTITLGLPTLINGNGTDALDVEGGHIIAPYADTIRMGQWGLTGGGNIKWGVVGSNFSWDSIFYVVGIGTGPQGSSDGYFQITMPVPGTALNVINCTARNWSADGVLLQVGESLMYNLPHGSNAASIDANFYVIGTGGSNFAVGHDWLTLATKPILGNTIRIGLGVLLKSGQTWVGTDGDVGTSDTMLKLTAADVFGDEIVSGMTFSVASLTSNPFTGGVAYVTGIRLVVANATKTFTANRDTYVDLNNTGVLIYKVVNNGAAVPIITANSLRLEKVVTNSTNVTSVTMLAPRDSFIVDSIGKVNISTLLTNTVSVGTGTLIGGTATITTTATGTNSLIFVTDTGGGVNIGSLTVPTKTPGVSFVVTSTNALDTSSFNWWIIN